MIRKARLIRKQLIALGGDPRTDIAVHSSAEDDEAQAAALDAIEELIAALEARAVKGRSK